MNIEERGGEKGRGNVSVASIQEINIHRSGVAGMGIFMTNRIEEYARATPTRVVC